MLCKGWAVHDCFDSYSKFCIVSTPYRFVSGSMRLSSIPVLLCTFLIRPTGRPWTMRVRACPQPTCGSERCVSRTTYLDVNKLRPHPVHSFSNHTITSHRSLHNTCSLIQITLSLLALTAAPPDCKHSSSPAGPYGGGRGDGGAGGDSRVRGAVGMPQGLLAPGAQRAHRRASRAGR